MGTRCHCLSVGVATCVGVVAGRGLRPPAEQYPASTEIHVPLDRGPSAASDKARDSASMPSAIVCTCSTIAGSAQMPNDNVSPSEITATRKA